ncbi:MAG: hypothetical protein HC898_09515 [Phycisphaerales bacterium]|nr:hypothetical protein [Phycisphaerales bacterium]
MFFYPQVSYANSRQSESTTDFSVRWTGYLQAKVSGTHEIIARSDDGVRLWIADELVIDDWEQRGAVDSVAKIELKAGQRVPLRVEYFQAQGVLPCSLPGTSPMLIGRSFRKALLSFRPGRRTRAERCHIPRDETRRFAHPIAY